MNHLTIGILACLVAGPDNGAKPPTPRERCDALIKEHQAADVNWEIRYKDANVKNAPDVLKIERYTEWPAWSFLPRFEELAEGDVKETATRDAILWIIKLRLGVGDNGTALHPTMDRVFARVARDYIGDREVISACFEWKFSSSIPSERLFRAILESKQERDLRGRAFLALARCLKFRASLARKAWFDEVQNDPLRFFIATNLHPDYLASIRAADPDALITQAKAAYDRVVKEFGDVKYRSMGNSPTLADVARSDLKEIAADARENAKSPAQSGVSKTR
jgi:hypothetical protein